MIRYTKNLIFSTITLLLVVVESNAQVRHFVGLRGGSNFTTAYFRNQFATRNQDIAEKQGFNAALLYRASLSKYTGIQADLGYIQKGWRQTFDIDDQEIEDYKVDLNYVRLQVASYFHLPLGNRKTQIYLTLGPYLDYLISHDINDFPNFNTLNISGITFFSYNEERDFKIGYGIGGSFGFQRKIGIGNIIVEGMLSVALSRIIDSGQPNVNEPNILRDEFGNTIEAFLPNVSSDITFGVNFGYLIPLGSGAFDD